MSVVASLRQRLRGAIELLPYGRDVYLALAGQPRLGIAYRGVYPAADAARASIPARRTNAYDRVNELKGQNQDDEKEKLGSWFSDVDYPLLFWVSRQIEPGLRVLELGGNLGHFYYSLADRAPLPDDHHWTIAELPEAVDLGRKIAAERGESRLEFIVSDRIEQAPECDLFVTAGTIQYMERSLADMLASLPRRPRTLLVHNTPMHRDREYWTRQDLGVCEVPYRVQSRSKFIDEIERLGYRLGAEWLHERAVEIPFHRELAIEGYCGFAFELGPEADEARSS